jgi:hypothetical protein
MIRLGVGKKLRTILSSTVLDVLPEGDGRLVLDAAGLFQTIFHPKESPRSRVDNLPICILPNWLKNIE